MRLHLTPMLGPTYTLSREHCLLIPHTTQTILSTDAERASCFVDIGVNILYPMKLLLWIVIVAFVCACEYTCPSPQVMCEAEWCTDLGTDDRHCGACWNACPGRAKCIDGACVCQTGYRECAGACVNLELDGENCGECGNACAPDRFCLEGICTSPMLCELYGFGTCGNACVDLAQDEGHCGYCDNVCHADEVCTAGICSCWGHYDPCPDGCVDLLTDNENCGVCGRSCGTIAACVDGRCVVT